MDRAMVMVEPKVRLEVDAVRKGYVFKPVLPKLMLPAARETRNLNDIANVLLPRINTLTTNPLVLQPTASIAQLPERAFGQDLSWSPWLSAEIFDCRYTKMKHASRIACCGQHDVSSSRVGQPTVYTARHDPGNSLKAQMYSGGSSFMPGTATSKQSIRLAGRSTRCYIAARRTHHHLALLVATNVFSSWRNGEMTSSIWSPNSGHAFASFPRLYTTWFQLSRLLTRRSGQHSQIPFAASEFTDSRSGAGTTV